MLYNDPFLSTQKLALALPAGAANALRGFNTRKGMVYGAGLGAAKGLLMDPGVDPQTGEKRSRVGAAVRNAAGGAAVGGAAGYLNQKFLVPNLKVPAAVKPVANLGFTPAPPRYATAEIVPPTFTPSELKDAVVTKVSELVQQAKQAGFTVHPTKIATMLADLSAGRAPEGAKPVILEIIKRAQAAGIDPTPELVAFNLLKHAARRMADYSDDLNHDLPGGKTTSTVPTKPKKPVKKASFEPPKLAAKG